MVAFGFILVLAGIIFLIIGAAQAAQNRYYATGTETVAGKVTLKRKRKRGDVQAYELTVAYIVNGNSYEKIVAAGLTEYEAIKEGDSIQLCYKSDNPKKAIRPETLNPRTVRVVLTIGGMLFAVGAALLVIRFIIGRM